MKPQGTPTSLDDSALHNIVDELTERLKRGEQVDLEVVVDQHPEFAEVIRRIWNTLSFLHTADWSQGADHEASVATPSQLGTLGDFRLIREIGRGGMGIVYEAEQISLRRRVALKVLPFASVLDDRQLRRFQNEAQAAALLRHENIVGVHSVGCDRGVHYYAMELIDGQSLSEVIEQLASETEWNAANRALLDRPRTNPSARGDHSPAQDAPCPEEVTRSPDETRTLAAFSTDDGSARHHYFRRVVALTAQAAEALQYAHEQGIIHRDIKPSNLLLDKNGKLWVADFGLAQMHGQGQLTMSGDLLGTLRYMSPEQAAGSSLVDLRTDVYSLGITLYELLALRPAFEAQNRERLLRQVIEEHPQPLRRLSPKVPKDLETIVLKATAQDREVRYETAQQLADDLQRFLQDRPVRARRATGAEHLLRSCRRNPVLACLTLITSCLLLIFGVGGPLIAWQQADLRSQSMKLTNSLLRSEATLRHQLYDARMTAAHAALEEGAFRRVGSLLPQYVPSPEQPEDLRGFEWFYLRRESRRAIEAVKITSWISIESLAFSPDRKYLAFGTWSGQLHVCDSSTHAKAWAGDAGDRVLSIAFSPDGRLVATGSQDGSVRLWNASNGQVLQVIGPLPNAACSVAFSPNGKLLAIALNSRLANPGSPTVESNAVRLYEVRLTDSGSELFVKLVGRSSPSWINRNAEDLSFSRDGKWLAAACRDPQIYLWNCVTGEERQITVFEATGVVRCVAASPSEDHLMAIGGGDFDSLNQWGEVKLCDLESQRLETGRHHSAGIIHVAYSNDGARLATVDENRAIAIWNANDSLEVTDVIRGHSGRINDIAFADGRTLASCSADNRLAVWDLSQPSLVEVIDAHRLTVLDLDFNVDDRSIVSGGSDGAARLWDTHSGKSLAVFPLQTKDGMAVDIHPDGRVVAVAGGEWPTKSRGELSLWDLAEGTKVRTLYSGSHTIWSARFSPSGDRIAAGLDRGGDGSPGGVIIWDARDGQQLQKLRIAPAPNVRRLAWSPDGNHIATCALGGPVQIWNCNTGIAQTVYPNEERKLLCSLTYSPDGSSIAAASQDGWIRVWRVENAKVADESEMLLSAHDGFVWYLDFSPDSRRLVSAGADGTVRIWNVRTGWELMAFREHAGWCWSAKFSNDGRTLAVGTNHVRSKIRFYRGASDHEIAKSLRVSTE